MSQIFSIGGEFFAIGLDWQSLRNDTSEKNEAADIAKSSGCSHGVIFSSDNISYLGLYSGQINKPPYCAAVCLAQSAHAKQQDNFVVIHPLVADGAVDDDSSDVDVWLCAIRNGVPLRGYDRIVPLSHVNELISELQVSYQDFTFYSQGGLINGTSDGSFVDFVNVEDDLVSKVVRLHGVSRSVFLACGFTTLVVAVICLSYFYFTNRAEAVALIESATKMRLIESSNLEAEAKESNRVNLEIAEMFNSKIGKTPLYVNMVSSWMRSIENSPVELAGWLLSDIDCTISSCVSKYTRQKGANLRDFIEESKSHGLVLGEISGNQVLVTGKISSDARFYAFDMVPDEEVGVWPLLTQLQLMEAAGLTFTVKKAEAISISTKAINDKAPVKIFSKWKMGEFILSGKNIYEVSDSIEYMNFDHVSAATLKINLINSSWSIGGFYATK